MTASRATYCRKWRGRWVTLLLFAGAACVSGTAVAQDARAAVAQSLFTEARRLMDEMQYAKACPMFEESQALEAAPGTLINLAVCHEQEGKLAAAWEEFQRVRAEAIRDKRPDRNAIAVEHIQALEPRLPKITVEVPPNSRTSGLQAWSKRKQSDEHCSRDGCNQEGADLSSDPLRSARSANIGFGVGLIGLGVAAVLVLDQPASSSQEPKVSAVVVPGQAASVTASMNW